MDKSKIVLEKVEVKKIKKISGNKLNKAENESRKSISKQSTIGKVSMENDLIDFAAEAYQTVAEVYPKTMTMAGDGYQQTNENRDLKKSEKCKLSTIISDDENKYYSETDSSTRSSSSFSPQSSFGFCESERSFQECKYDKLKGENYSSLKELDTESEKPVQSDNSDETFSDEYIRQKDNLTISQNVYDKVTVRNSVGEKISVARSKYFGDQDTNINSCENLVRKRWAPQKGNLSTPQHIYDMMIARNFVGETKFIAETRHEVDEKVDSKENPIQVKDNSSSQCEEEDQIKILKGALEKSTNCLVKCLESFQSKTKNQKKLSLRKDYTKRKSGSNASEYKNGEKDVKILDANNADVSLLTSHDLENESVTDVKQIMYDDACLTCVNSPKSIYTKTTKSKNCLHGCGNGRCLHFPSTRRNLNGDLAQEAITSNKKIPPSASKEDFSNNQRVLNDKLQESRTRSKFKKRHRLTSPDMPILAVKVMGVVENGNASFKQADRSNADDNQPFENWLSSLEKSNLIKKGKNGEHHPKRKEKSNLAEISHENDQLEKYEDDDISEDYEVSEYIEVLEDKKGNLDPNLLMFLTFIFIISVFLCFLFSIFIFII